MGVHRPFAGIMVEILESYGCVQGTFRFFDWTGALSLDGQWWWVNNGDSDALGQKSR